MKNLENLGKVLNKAEQKIITGGCQNAWCWGNECSGNDDCPVEVWHLNQPVCENGYCKSNY